MTPEEIQQLVRESVKLELQNILKTDRFVFDKLIQLLDGTNIQVGRNTGMEIGTEPDQKIGIYGATPVVQASAIIAPIGGAVQDAESRTAINFIRTAIKNFGITA